MSGCCPALDDRDGQQPRRCPHVCLPVRCRYRTIPDKAGQFQVLFEAPEPLFRSPPARCSRFLEGRPLFFDADHLTAYSNSLLYPSLKAAVMVTTDRKQELRAIARRSSDGRPEG
jgi:hypothetical protein